MKQFNEWLQKELRVRGWKPADLSKGSGLVPSTISRILSGQTKPSDDALRKIARALGEPPEKILRQAGRLPQVDNPSVMEQDLLDSFRRLTEHEQVFLIRLLRSSQGQPWPVQELPATRELPEPKTVTLADDGSSDIEVIIELIRQLDILERRLVYDYVCWRLNEQEQRRNSSDRRQKSKEMREAELRQVMEYLDLMIAIDEADAIAVQRVITRLQNMIDEKQAKQAPPLPENSAGLA